MPPRYEDVWLIALWLLISSCNGVASTREVTFDNLNVRPIITQALSERRWPDDALGNKLIDLPAGTDTQPSDPQDIIADINGNFYVGDNADYKVKQFDAAGNYVKSIGAGKGEGPGESIGVHSVGVLADTVFYQLDGNQRVDYFRVDGTSFRSERVSTLGTGSTQMHQLAITAGGRQYFMLSAGYEGGHFFETRWQGNKDYFGRLQHETGWELDLPLFGKLTTYQEDMIYVPVFFPLVLRFGPDGSLRYARTTLDYGKVPVPEYAVGANRRSPPSARLTGWNPSVDGTRLFVHARFAQAIDVYDVTSGDYLYSVKLPESNVAHVKNERLYLVQDHGVSVWVMNYVM